MQKFCLPPRQFAHEPMLLIAFGHFLEDWPRPTIGRYAGIVIFAFKNYKSLIVMQICQFFKTLLILAKWVFAGDGVLAFVWK